MPSETADCSEELYIVEVNGVKSSEHRIFIEALKCEWNSSDAFLAVR
jgi:mitochondrial fission protein ELM1